MTSSRSLERTWLRLNFGFETIPAVGFGTLIRDPAAARRAIRHALDAGFRHFDTAELYHTEHVLGDVLREAFAEGVVRRDEIFVTTKLWNNNHRPERVGPALDASLSRLRLDYVDAYLVHTPFAFPPSEEQHPRDALGNPVYDDGVTLEETWGAMERLVGTGKARAIGLSDLRIERLREIIAVARITPAIVQVEAHPYLPEWDLLDYCRRHGIVLQAFAPLGHGMEPRVTEDPVICAIARTIGKTPAQVALAWAVQRGTALLTTSTSAEHIRENFDLPALSVAAMREIREGVDSEIRFNAVVETGVPGFVPRPVLS